jgi:hypothetical protein
MDQLLGRVGGITERRWYTEKKVIVFSVPIRDVTNQTLSGRELLNYSRLGRVWLVTSRLGSGKTITFFYSVAYSIIIGGTYGGQNN